MAEKLQNFDIDSDQMDDFFDQLMIMIFH
ncbi:hypothetical protein CT123_06175 [Staphylococcus aureus]|nr:hypothetical protein CT123_06175 [Staphylococcus aureus]